MNRRELWPMFGASLMGGMLGVPGAFAARSPAAIDAPSGIDTLLTHVRMRAHPDGRAVYWWYSGTFYGQITGQRTLPLLGIEGLSINRCTPAGDRVFAYSLREAGWFKDLATGQVLDEWSNPLTGRIVTPKHYYSPQQTRFVGSTVEPVLTAPMPGLEYVGYLGRPEVFAGSLWSSEELFVRTTDPSTGAGRVQTSLLTLQAAAQDLGRSATRFVPATMAYQTLASWRPWMEMGDVPGVISWRLYGRKVASVAELPPAIVARTRTLHPQLFEG